MEDAFVQFATTGKLSFRSLIDAMLADLARLSIRILMSEMLKRVFGAMLNAGMFGGGGDGFIVPGNAGYAAGGNVMGGRPIWVGENGKELFVPPNNGKIIPNHEISEGGMVQPVNITYHIGSIGSNVSRQDIAVALDQTRQTTIAQIREMNRRNATVIR
jgi:phage-related minor tail protein